MTTPFVFPPRFPALLTPAEPLAEFRHRATTAMKVWVKLTVSDMSGARGEHEARVVCEHYALQELGRPMYRAEERLMMEAIRDVLTVWQLERDLRDMERKKADLRDTQERLHRPGRLFA